MRLFIKGILLLIVVSCTSAKDIQQDIITISGTIKNVGVGDVLLEKFENNTLIVVDTFMVKDDGSYSGKYQPEEPGYYRINFYQTQFVTILFSGSPLEVNVDGSGPNAPYEVKGSEEMEKLGELSSLMANFNNEVGKLNEAYGAAAKAGDNVKMEEIRVDFENRQIALNNSIKIKIRSMIGTVAVLQAINYLNKDQEFEFIDSVASVIDKSMPDYKIKRDFMDEIEQLRVLAIGSIAPEIELPNPSGEMVKLSSLRGSVVLIDFWAAWCGPCRKENPNVVRMFNKYNSKGFEVFGVSLDRKKEDWVNAIEKDGLNWTQVSDLQYFNSKAAQQYKVNAIPATYLIDRDGKIIGKDLRGAALEAKLQEIFG